MVSWSGNSYLSGYNSVFHGTDTEAFVFTTNGVTNDINGATRLGWYLRDYQFSPIDSLVATVTLNYTAGDIASLASYESLGVLVYVSDGDKWPAGYVPTPREIITNYTQRWWPGGFTRTAGVHTWEVNTNDPTPDLQHNYVRNNKLWVAAVPAKRTRNPFNQVVEYVPYPGWSTPSMGANARGLSVWTSRTPEAPVITSPAPGSVFNPGERVLFRFDPKSPDKTTPDDSSGFNADLAGVEIQYSAVPTPDNPDPSWNYLDMWKVDTKDDDGDGNTTELVHAPSWYIARSTYAPAAFFNMIANRGVSLYCGVDEPQENAATLPGGTWRIRVRTFGYGHPQPGVWPPLGDFNNPSQRLTPSSFNVDSVSPWSTPLTITVTSQVATPTLLSPRDSIALSDDRDSVRLSWKHRSAARPAFAQKAREIQMRKVGDPDWVSVAYGVSGNEFFDMPMVLDSPPIVGEHEYLGDLGFEAGTVNGWVGSGNLDETIMPTDGTQTVINVTGGAHGGSKYIAIDYAGAGWATMSKTFTLDAADTSFKWSGWMKPDDASDFTFALMIWYDSDDNVITLGDDDVANGVGETKDYPSWGGWVGFDTGWFPRPAGAVKVELTSYSFIGTSDGHGLDDLSFKGRNDYQTGDFTMEATSHYQWRARTMDTDDEWSSFSPPESFWLVPAPASGSGRPIPSETIDGATLGCGTHTAWIYRRGGLTRVGELTGITHLDWERKRDDISTAKVVVKDWNVDCGNLLSRLQTWAYEMVIFRDNGYGVERVWEGPITLLTYEVDSVTVEAKDVMGYAYRRIIKQQMTDTGSGDTVVNRAARVLQNTFAPDDPNVLQWLTPITRGDDAKEYRSTPPYSRTAFEEVDDMAANAGLDYTCVGRRIMLWGTKHRIGTLPEFRDEDLGAPPIVSEYGMSMANRYVVSDGNGVWGEATRLDVSGNDENYGLVEMLSSTWASDSADASGQYTPEGLETIRESFAAFAERSISDRFPPPVVVRIPDNTTLNPGAVLSIQQLVPGVVIPLRSTGTLRQVVASQKLDSVKVVEEKGNETISVTMSPFSRDDGSTEGEVTT